MSRALNENPFLNSKYVEFTFEGIHRKLRVRAFATDLCDDGVAYHVETEDRKKTMILGRIKLKWYRLDTKNDFASFIGGLIDEKVNHFNRLYFEEKWAREKEARRKK